MTRHLLPFLRTPPFPGVDPATGAVSRPGAGATGPAPCGELLRAIARARVGGTFWAPAAAPLDDDALVVRAADAETARRLLAGRAEPRDVTILGGPQGCAGWNVEAQSWIEGDVDPWSLLRPGVRLLAAPGDEWRIVARAIGCEIVGTPVDDPEIAAALLGPACRDPFTGRPATVEETIARLAGWRRLIDRNRGIAACVGMAWWKRERIGQFLWCGRTTPLVFAESEDEGIAAAVAGGGALACWPSRVTPALIGKAAAAGIRIVTVEDGFIRSVGLGADLLPPWSIVVDDGGIYFDPDSGSDLERILQHDDVPAEARARAGRLGGLMVARGISKYGSAPPPATAVPRARRTVLVAGQVEDDLSVARAGGDVAGNLDLLRRARAAEPDALLLFKPHPDVDAGHRVGRVPDDALLTHADAVIRDQPLSTLLARVDAVHVLTSLVGFEALLRGLETHVHGRPFYAGWGLTVDHGAPCPGRTRRRTLEELIAATLILYPRYIDPVTALPCPPEILADRFAAGWAPRRSLLVSLRRLQGRLFKLVGRATS